jgi:hemolysin activation/secretion protein
VLGLLAPGFAQESAPLPSSRIEEEESDPLLIPIEPPSLIPEPPWREQPFLSRSLRLAPPVVEPVLPPLRPVVAGNNAVLSMVHVFVKRFKFTGNHLFSSATLSKVTAKYAGREITAEELEQARQDLTLFYINQGYINSGATLPDQDIGNGVIVIRIVEGRLSEIQVSGNRWFRPWWLRNEVRRSARRELNFTRLKEGLQLLRQNPTIARVNAELKPGGVPGESILDVAIRDTHPFRAGVEFSNRRPPSVGAEIVEIRAADLNLTGHNDPLRIRYGIAHTTREGGFDFSGDENIEGSYEFPVTPWGTTMQLYASKSDTSIIEAPFTALDIQSELEQFSATLRQPIYQRLNNDFTVSFSADRRRSQTFLLGEPFSLSPGAVNGETAVCVLRFAQEFTNRSQVHVLALRSTFNLGIDALEATNSGAEPDSRFFSWLGQGQYVRRLGNTDNLLVLRLAGQIASEQLFALEQLSLGGADSVRGYRENQILRDSGILGSAELRIPIIRGKDKNPLLVLAPFFDIGAGWNAKSERDDEALPSAGVGFIFTPRRNIQAQLYWGYAFNRDQVGDGENLQDYGIHFAISVDAF